MRILQIALFLCGLCLVLTGCETTKAKKSGANAPVKSLKPGVISVFLSGNIAQGGLQNIRKVYVFPPLELDENGRQVGNLMYAKDNTGNLVWNSDAPMAMEMKSHLENHLRKEGYQPVTFKELQEMNEDYSVLVINPYFSKPLRDEESPERLIVFGRILVGTYTRDLSPEKRIELVNQETLTFYNPNDNYLLVTRRSLQHALSYMGMDRDWIQLLSLNQ